MTRRTTIAAEDEVLETLRAEARRKGVSLATLVGEFLKEKAEELRRSRRPHVGIGRSGSGVSQDSVDREDLPAAQ
ncbi:MAG TPA: hypothetical protein VEK15_15620 [Vicinamibacteria bacterium]|nr:hypothetical protein [Vicinamibacteria bacterium]